MPYEFNAESAQYLYIATPYALVQVEKDSGTVKNLAGYTRDLATGVYDISLPIGLNVYNSYLYAGDLSGKIFGVFTGDDNYGAIELLYNGHLPGMNNAREIFGNSTHLIYTGDDGLHWMPYGHYKNSQFLTKYPAGSNRIAVTDNEVFFATNSPPDRSISRYDLNSGAMEAIKTGIQTFAGDTNPPRMTWHAPYLYWADGNAIDRYDTGTAQMQRIASNVADYIEGLVANDDAVYAYERYGYPPHMVRVDISTGQVTTVWDSLLTTAVTMENGNVYFLEGGTDPGVYRVIGDNSPEKYLTGADLNWPAIWDLTSGGGMLFLSVGDIYNGKFAAHDLSAGISKVFNLVYFPQFYIYHDQSVISYMHNGSGALTRIPLDKPLRPLVKISPERASSGAVRSLVRHGNYIYWIWASDSAADYRVSRVSVDSPGPAEDLFQSSSELRDIFIRNGLIYFSCLDECGGPGWVLVNMGLNGGAVTPFFGLGGDPRTFYLNGVCYVADTLDFFTSSIFAINLDHASFAELVSNLYYSPDDSFALKASSKWLYVGHLHYNQGGPPDAKISRHKIIDWETIGPEEVIASQGGFNVDFSLMPSTMSTDGKYLYFWEGAIKRVAE